MSVRHYDWIAHFGRRTPDKPAVVDLASERTFTYAQFDTRISRLAAHLRDALKIKRGDRVAVLAHNTTDTLEVQFACGAERAFQPVWMCQLCLRTPVSDLSRTNIIAGR